jgi:hypothetical protein
VPFVGHQRGLAVASGPLAGAPDFGYDLTHVEACCVGYRFREPRRLPAFEAFAFVGLIFTWFSQKGKSAPGALFYWEFRGVTD